MGTQEHWTAAQYQEYLRQRAKGNNKYHAVKVEVDGTVYASQSESRRAKELHLLERHGLIVQGVIRTMDLSKAEAVCRDLINLGTVAGMAIEERNNEE
jgi:hypothetical protein